MAQRPATASRWVCVTVSKKLVGRKCCFLKRSSTGFQREGRVASDSSPAFFFFGLHARLSRSAVDVTAVWDMAGGVVVAGMPCACTWNAVLRLLCSGGLGLQTHIEAIWDGC